MIKKIIILLVISMLLLSSISVVGINIKSIKTNINDTQTYTTNEADEFDYTHDYKKSNIIPGQVIVKFNKNMNYETDGVNAPSTGIESVDELNSIFEVTSMKPILQGTNSFSLKNVYLIDYFEDADPIVVAEQYAKDPNVEIAEPNELYQYCTIPNDARFNDQWALDQITDMDIDAPEAWDITTGSNDVVVALIDSGVDSTHPDLIGKTFGGWDFITNTGLAIDTYGHGSHCAGIIAANSNNNIGIAGISWNCKIMPLKTGSDSRGLYKDLCIEAIAYAADNGADIISMSWGSDDFSPLQETAIKYAYSKGVVLIGAAGNDNSGGAHYPSGFDEVISVGATDINDERWLEEVDGLFGTYWVGSNYGESVDVSAPGKDILSTVPLAAGEGLYTKKTGTSMAAPHVAGVAALLLADNPDLTPEMVREKICSCVDTIDTDEDMGYGRVNAYKALTGEPMYAFLDTITNWDNIKGSLPVQGSAYGDDFSSYELSYGWSKDPDEWTQISQSDSSVFHGTLGTFYTASLKDGAYTLKLTVETNDGSIYNNTKSIVVNNNNQKIYVDSSANGPGVGSSASPFKELKDALDAAGRQDTVFLKTGTYKPLSYNQYGYPKRKGTFLIDREIKLEGENNQNTIITHDGDQESYLLEVSADNVEITNLKFETKTDDYAFYGGAIEIISSNNHIHDNYFSTIEGGSIIDMQYSSNNIIEDNVLSSQGSASFRGISLAYFSNNNIIRRNTISNQLNCGIGMWYACENNLIEDNEISNPYYGIIIYDVSKNTVKNNRITDCNKASSSAQCGIDITDYASENLIEGNEILNGEGHGIYMEWKANKNTICKNKIKNNAKFGIRTSHSWSYWLFPEPAIYCSGNVFYQNALADNLAGNARDDGENIWYSIHIKAGNYYDDYDGEDRNKDKIGDSPYIVEGVRICYYSDPFDDPEEKFRIPITHRDLYPLMDSNGKAKNMDKEGAFNAFLNYISTFSTQIQNIINRIYQKLEVNFL